MKKKKIIMLISIIVVCIIVLCQILVQTKVIKPLFTIQIDLYQLVEQCKNFIGYQTQIKTDTVFFDDNKHIIFSNDRILFDTGSKGTVLFKKFNDKKTWIGFSNITDYNNNSKFFSMYFTRKINFDTLKINNLLYTLITDTNYVAKSIQTMKFGGILGMNAISTKNWLLDFNKNCFQIIDNYNNNIKIILKYKNKFYPQTTIEIAKNNFNNVLIDTGSSDGDIILLLSDIEQINKFLKPDTIINGFSNGLFSDSITRQQFFYSNIYVNDILFENLVISSGVQRLMGIGFFRKFDKVFWNSEKKEVSFYKNY